MTASLVDQLKSNLSNPAQRSRVLGFLLTLTLGLLALALRRPEPFLHPTFFAEDGPIFFGQVQGLNLSVLQIPYNGYLHTWQRLVTLGTYPLPLEWLPALYTYSTLLSVAGLAWMLSSPRLSLKGGPLLMAMVVAMPHTGEVWGNLTNVQWTNALMLFVLLVSEDPKGRASWIRDLVVVTLVGLSGVFSLVLAPFFVWRAWLRRTWAAVLITALVLATAATQLSFVLQDRRETASETPRSAGDLLVMFGHRIISASILGPQADQLPRATHAVVAVGGAVLLGVLALRRRKDGVTLILAGAIVVFVAAAYFRLRPVLDQTIPFRDGDRYFFLPKVLLGWLICHVLAETKWPRLAPWVLLAYLVGLNSTFRTERWASLPWSPVVERLRKGEQVRIPTNPPGYTFLYRLPKHRR